MAVLEHEPIKAAESEKPALNRIEGVLAKNRGAPKLIDPDGGEIELPQSVFQVLKQIIHHMMRGRAIFIVPENKELTTQEAAEILCVSRPYFIKLLENGKIPYLKVGSHRRIRFSDLMYYQRKREKEREEGLEEIARLSQETGIYD
jgi:excisionase family DNA binding protein